MICYAAKCVEQNYPRMWAWECPKCTHSVASADSVLCRCGHCGAALEINIRTNYHGTYITVFDLDDPNDRAEFVTQQLVAA